MDTKRIKKIFFITFIVTLLSILICGYLFNKGVFYKTDVDFFNLFIRFIIFLIVSDCGCLYLYYKKITNGFNEYGSKYLKVEASNIKKSLWVIIVPLFTLLIFNAYIPSVFMVFIPFLVIIGTAFISLMFLFNSIY